MIDTIEEILLKEVIQAVHKLSGEVVEPKSVQFQKTRKEFRGDVTLVVFPLVKMLKKSPEQAGEDLGNLLKSEVEYVTAFNTVKGFLNLEISDQYWLEFFNDSLKNGKFGFGTEDSKPTVMVEYSSPNTNKPLHLGHLRNIFLGYSVANILKAYGHKTLKTQIVNDRGIHICKSMIAWEKFGEGDTPESTGLKGDHFIGKYYVRFNNEYNREIEELVASGQSEDEAKEKSPLMQETRVMLRKWEQGDLEVRALWEKMNGWVYQGFDKTYDELGVSFDKEYFESDTYLKGLEAVLTGLEKGVFYQREDGSVWIDLKEDGLDEKIIQRGDGTTVYMTQDIGTAIQRFEDFPDLTYQIYTVGNEQEYHFKVLFLILKKLGMESAHLNHHLSYGMVELPTGKMKSREGTVVDADDLLEEMHKTAKKKSDDLGKLDGVSEEDRDVLYKQIGYGALKYFLLKIDPRKNMTFDPESSVDFVGNTGPFIQYGHVRAKAIVRNAKDEVPVNCSLNIALQENEKAIITRIYDFPEVLKEAAETYSPAIIGNYSYELVKDFNSFYQSTNILKEENDDIRIFRIALASKLASVLKNAMGLLGIEMPERM